ncbi:Oidioi.mRNA.OKI2018_I69.chr2.g8345.t1.cds [Oikopleura dioica]|uniref:GPI inositol-deacylase n=1 Tax=Oikopleura dioica TaxID=34765 RepID=A0ABN7TF55_OIKDI|nr:Oidioi.mRNA.OKI2018_I69.chr2.g8345.t1.cds [Oikopleura dioica]
MGLGKLFIIWGFTFMGGYHMYRMFVDQKSKMTWMWEKPRYHEIKLAESGSRNSYGLYFYGEGQYFKNEIAKGFRDSAAWPVLFVPGSGGSYKQCRSIGSVLYNKWKKAKEAPYFHTYAIDLKEELTGIYGGPLEDHVKFVRSAIQEILEYYPTDAKLTIVGHSMGGMVAKAVVNQFADRVNFLLTLGSPHAYPVISDRILKRFTAQHWNEKLKVPCLSVVGGLRDVQVRSALSFDEECKFIRGESVPGTWVSQDHQSLVWDNGLVLATARSIYDTRRYPEEISQVLNYHWAEKTNSSNQYSPPVFAESDSPNSETTDLRLAQGSYKLPEVEQDVQLIVYGDIHRVQVEKELSNSFMISEKEFFTQTSITPDSNGFIQTSGDVSRAVIASNDVVVVPYVISGLFKWIPGMSTKTIELKGPSIVELEGLLMTYQVFDISTDRDSHLIVRENGKASIIGRNNLTVSLTRATKESTTQGGIFIIFPLTDWNSIGEDENMKMTLNVNIFAVFDILFREYWSVIVSFIVVQAAFVAASIVRGKQATWVFWEVLSFVSKPYYICPLLSICHGAFTKSWLEWLVPAKDSKFAPDSEVLDSRELFHPIVCIICFLFAGVFLETLAFCVYALLRLTALLFGRFLDLFQMLFSVKLLILACSAILVKTNGSHLQQIRKSGNAKPKERDTFWVDFIVLLCLLLEFALLLPSFIFWIHRSVQMDSYEPIPFTEDPGVIPGLIITIQYPFDLAALELSFPRKNAALILAVYSGMYCLVNIHRLTFVLPILIILLRSASFSTAESEVDASEKKND